MIHLELLTPSPLRPKIQSIIMLFQTILGGGDAIKNNNEIWN